MLLLLQHLDAIETISADPSCFQLDILPKRMVESRMLGVLAGVPPGLVCVMSAMQRCATDSQTNLPEDAEGDVLTRQHGGAGDGITAHPGRKGCHASGCPHE